MVKRVVYYSFPMILRRLAPINPVFRTHLPALFCSGVGE
jgi:hypothetical protein